MKMEVLARNQYQAAQFDGIGSTKTTDWTKPLTPPTSAIQQHQQQHQQQLQLQQQQQQPQQHPQPQQLQIVPQSQKLHHQLQLHQHQQQQQLLSKQLLQPQVRTFDLPALSSPPPSPAPTTVPARPVGHHRQHNHQHHHHHSQHHHHHQNGHSNESRQEDAEQKENQRHPHMYAMDLRAINDLSMRLQQELRAAKTRNLACTEVLLPADLLDRIATDMVQMAEKEPCGIRGCAVYIEFEDEPGNSRRIASMRVGEESVVATFELYLTLRHDQSGWTAKLPQFLKNLARRSTIIISPDYTLIKNKLYNSFLE